MTAEQLTQLVGIVLSLAFSYVPQLQAWYEPKDGMTKRLVMLGLGVVTVGVIYGASCAGVAAAWLPVVECTQAGALGLGKLLLDFAIANQTAFLLTPKRATN